MIRTSWFWKWFMKRSYRKSQSNLSYYVVGEHFPSFTEFLARARKLGPVGLANYVPDRFFGAVNRIDHPKLALRRLLEFEKLYKINKDLVVNKIPYDCDDHASALLQLGHRFDGYLMTYFTDDIRDAHTIPLFKEYGGLWVVDWSISIGSESLIELIQELEEIRDINIKSVHFAKFNANAGKFITIKKEALM